MSCDRLPIEQLVSHVDGELAADEDQAVVRHLAACAECAAEAALLRRSGDLIAALPRHEPGPEFTRRVLAAARSDAGAQAAPRARLLRLWPAAAAAAALLAVLGARVWLAEPRPDDEVLTAREEQAIAADLYVLANLDALEEADPDELISLVENLDLLEGTEPEVSGMFGAVDEEGR